MQRLYRGKLETDVLFLSEDDDERVLRAIGKQFLKNQGEYTAKTFTIQEITAMQEVPLDWRGNDTLLWGSDDQKMTAERFLSKNSDPDYQLYLQLKERFEK